MYLYGHVVILPASWNETAQVNESSAASDLRHRLECYRSMEK
jgi:hypothetical protein